MNENLFMSNSALNLEIVDKIGSGGMGVIYLAYLVGAGGFKKKVIAKKVKKGEHRAKLLTEARLQAELSHPNISQIIDIRTVNDEDYIISEFIEGENLKSLLDRHRSKHEKLSLETVNSIFWQIVNAVKYLHSKSIIHGDLTPSNIMISNDNHVKVIDFGLSIETLDFDKTIYTENVVGTVDYLSPERIDKQKVSKSSDVFALGIILIEMITLRNPFKSENQFKTLESIKYLDPIQNVKIELNEKKFLDIATKLLEKDPRNRIKTDQLAEHHTKSLNRRSAFGFTSKVWKGIAMVFAVVGAFLAAKHYLNNKAHSDFLELSVIRNSVPVKIENTMEFDAKSSTQCHTFYRKLQSHFDLLFYGDVQKDYIDKVFGGNFQNAILGVVRFIENNQKSISEMFKQCNSDRANQKMAALFNANLTMLDFLIKGKVSSLEEMYKAGFTKELITKSYNAVLGFSPVENFAEKFNAASKFIAENKKDFDYLPSTVLVRYIDIPEAKMDNINDCRALGTTYWIDDRILSIYKDNLISKKYHLLIVPRESNINLKGKQVYIDLMDNSKKICEYKVENLIETVSIY